MPSADRIASTQSTPAQMGPYTSSSVNASRGVVLVNGTEAPAWLDWEVENNALSAADTFSVRFAGAALPAGTDVNWFSSQTDMFIEIFAGFPSDIEEYTHDELTKLIYGQVDTIDYDMAEDVVTVHGRDLTRVFIDAKTTEKFPNQTSSQIAETLARRRGLSAAVIATKTKAGAYYDIEHVNLMDERTEWDILCFLAQQEGFQVYVKDRTLYFGPPPSEVKQDTSALEADLAKRTAEIDSAKQQLATLDKQSQALVASGDKAGAAAVDEQYTQLASRVSFVMVPYQIEARKKLEAAQAAGTYQIKWVPVSPHTSQWRAFSANVESMRFQRTLTVSRGVTVVVRSWSDKQQYGFNAVYPQSKVGSIKPGASSIATGGQVFTFFYPNIDKQRALQIAKQKYDLIVKHEMKFECRLPGDTALDTQSVISVSGTQTAWDQKYYPASIVRRMSFEGGFEMTVHGKNHAATSEAASL